MNLIQAFVRNVGNCRPDAKGEIQMEAPGLTARDLRQWLNDLGVKTLFIEPGSPWENGYIEPFNGKLRNELLNIEIFTTLMEAKVLIENWRREYNEIGPHSSLGYRPPAPRVILPNYRQQITTLHVVQGFGAGHYGAVMGAWIEPVDKDNTKVTVVTKRRIATNIATTLTESTFHKRFAQAVDIVKAGKPLP